MSKVIFTVLGILLSFNANAANSFFSKNKYKAQKFEFECAVYQGVFPEAVRNPFCPSVFQFDFPVNASMATVELNIEKALEHEVDESIFTKVEADFISDMKLRQFKGIDKNFADQYDKLFKTIYRSIKKPVVWATPSIGYIVLVSPTQHTLYVIESGAMKK